MKLNAINPEAKITSPTDTQLREPKRLISQPCSGPRNPLSRRESEKAPETRVRLHPNSFWRKTK
jgi:hypothetical protein